MAPSVKRASVFCCMTAFAARLGLQAFTISGFTTMGTKVPMTRLQRTSGTDSVLAAYSPCLSVPQAEISSVMPSLIGCLLAGVAIASSARRQQRFRVVGVNRGCAPLEYGEDLGVADDAFVVLGLAHCFKQVEGKLEDAWVLEPVSASTVEVVDNGAQTSYEAFFGTTVGQLLAQDIAAFPAELFCGHKAQWGDNLKFRTGCAARTWMRDHARDVVRALVPLGTTVKTLSRGGEFNTSTEHKRILNFVNVVNDSDNVKQDMSIDVYGRDAEKDEEELASQIEELSNV